jgi:predicted TIM-barrel fold metal-dependent hydrolase
LIVDSHVHLFYEGSDPEEFFVGCARTASALFGKETGEYSDPVELYKYFLGILSDRTGDKLVAAMNEAGVDKAILLPLDFWLKYPKASGACLTMEEKNRIYAEATERYPNRLLSLFGIDPRRRDALRLFEKGIEEWGMKGLKIHPTAGFYPDDPICYPIYERAQEYGVSVLIHSGNEPAPMAVKYSQPKYIDTIAADFPELKIIIAHMGHGWWREAVDIATMKPNIYLDFSGWQPLYTSNPDYLWYPLRMAIDLIGPWRVLFGTDGSMLNVLMPLKDWVNAVKTPKSPTGIEFSPKEIEIIMGKAAAKLYSIYP